MRGVIIAGILLAHVAIGQSPAARLAFVKANLDVSAPGTREEGGFLPEGRFECRGVTLLKLISMAYGVNQNQVVGGPDWLPTNRFDVVARAPAGKTSQPEVLEMLRTLLADRFGLTIDPEQQDIPVYLLTLGPKGLKMQESDHPQTPECPSTNGDPRLNHRTCRDFSMEDLANLLPEIARNYIDRPVADNTGLKGFYNFPLNWMSKPTFLAAKADGSEAVSLNDALESLGLKLEPGTRPMPAIVVKQVNATPSANPAEGTEAPARFEVVDVRPSKASADRQGLSALPSGQVEILGYTVRELILLAFEVKSDRVSGGPKWLDSDRFDVIAKSPDAMSPHAIAAMVKTLLQEHFQLRTHTEDHPLPVFALVAGKESPKMKASDGSARSQCDLVVADQGRSFTCRNTTMSQLADRLPNVAQAYFTLPLVDQTGLKGAFDFTLTWTPKNPRSDRRGPEVGAQAPTPPGGLTIFEAIEKQLGLKVEERKHPLPVIVIDGAEKG
jgi:uncharacterized protein (TIGR03435 family)